MSTCWDYLKKEVLVVSHAVRAHLWATAAIGMGLYIVGTVAYHFYTMYIGLGG